MKLFLSFHRFWPQPGLLTLSGAAALMSLQACNAAPPKKAPNAKNNAKPQGNRQHLTVQARVNSVAPAPGQQLGQAELSVQEASLTPVPVKRVPQNIGPNGGDWAPEEIVGPRAGRDRLIRVRVPGAARLSVSVSVAGQSATETVEGPMAAFVLRNQNKGPLQLVPASWFYERSLQWARETAVAPQNRPKQLIIGSFVRGMDSHRQSLDNALETMSLLGINTLQISQFGQLNEAVAPIAAQKGITRFSWSRANPPVYFDWAQDAQNPRPWAVEQKGDVVKSGLIPEKLAYFQVEEEPAWYFPGHLNLVRRDEGALQKFRAFLQAQNLQPADLGATDWSQVVPVGAGAATDLPGRRRFYWTTRFYALGAARGLQTWGDALRRELNNPNLPVVVNNYANGSRSYFASPDQQIDKYGPQGADTAAARYNWFDIGRLGAPAALWTEDWLPDEDAAIWSYHADILRSAARENPANTFGGFVMGRAIGNLGEAGGKYKGLALVGHGAKILHWYQFGPEPTFSTYSWSDNKIAYRSIAATNSLIGASEDVLAPGVRAASPISILVPRSAFLWDKKQGDPGYHRDVRGLHSALIHAGFPVDFTDEDGIALGNLEKYGVRVVYITAPNLTYVSMRALKTWIQNGGTAIFCGPDVVSADEYNTPTNFLDETRGVASNPRGDQNDDGKGGTARFSDARFGGQTKVRGNSENLQLRGATALAKYDDGGVAVATMSFGKGRTLSYGFRPGIAYFASGKSNNKGLPQGWDSAARQAVVAPVSVAGVGKTVELSQPIVEASRLDSAAGIGVTLLNWTGAPIGQLGVTIKNAGAIRSASLASGAPVSMQRVGNDVRVSVALRDVDVLVLRR